MKRPIDFFVSIICFLILLPLQICIAISILIIDGRPVLFLQSRPGLNGKVFTLYQFRSMTKGDGQDAERLTSFGGL
ncbi:sugar transferase [PVC group bacterium]|nr:sugar transferase [PVC group bacterium]